MYIKPTLYMYIQNHRPDLCIDAFTSFSSYSQAAWFAAWFAQRTAYPPADV